MKALPSEDKQLEKQIHALLREALGRRYELAHLRKYSEFDPVPDNTLETLRLFGLRHIYPDWEQRAFQIRIFQKTQTLLQSPTRLMALSRTALLSLFRFSAQVPCAVKAGMQVISAFDATRKLEEKIFSHARRLNLEDRIEKEGMGGLAPALAALVPEDYETYLQGLTALVQILIQPRLLDAGESILGEMARAMRKRPGLFDEEERQGAQYAAEALAEGRKIFNSLPTDVIAGAAEGIPHLELDWLAEASQKPRS